MLSMFLIYSYQKASVSSVVLRCTCNSFWSVVLKSSSFLGSKLRWTVLLTCSF